MKNQPNPETKSPAKELTEEERKLLRELLRIILEDKERGGPKGYGVFTH